MRTLLLKVSAIQLAKFFGAMAAAVVAATACDAEGSQATPTEGPSRTPVVFVPGITGSQLAALDGHVLWPPGGTDATTSQLLFSESISDDFTRLSLNPETGPHAALIPTDVIRDYGGPVYSTLLGALANEGYVEYQVGGNPTRRTASGCDMTQKDRRPTLFVFAYDWRMENEDSARRLADYIGCVQRFYPGTKVNIVTHSMGGLVARRYIIDHPNTVNRLITVAAPFLGSAKPLYQMIYGLLGTSTSQVALSTVYNDEVTDMLKYYPGLHQLMATEAYFELGGQPFSDTTTTREESFLDFDEVMGPGGIVAFLFDGKSYNGKTPAQSNRDFHSYCNGSNCQDDWSTDRSGTKLHHLIGVQQANDTPLTVRRSKKLLSGEIEYEFSAQGPGDGTVPRLSAERRGNGRDLNAPNAKTYVFDSGDDALLEHTGIMTNAATVSRVIAILKEKDEETTPIPAASPARTPTRVPTSTPAPTPTPEPTNTPAPVVFRYELRKSEVTCRVPSDRCTASETKGKLVSPDGKIVYEAGLQGSSGAATVTNTHDMSFFNRANIIDAYSAAWGTLPAEMAPGEKYSLEIEARVAMGNRTGVEISAQNTVYVADLEFDAQAFRSQGMPLNMANTSIVKTRNGSFTFNVSDNVAGWLNDPKQASRAPKEAELKIVFSMAPTASNPTPEGFVVVYTYELVVGE